MKLRLLLPALATAFALTGCVAYEDYYGYGPGYYRSNEPAVVYRRYGGYPYGYYDDYYYDRYYGGYPYRYGYGYPYYGRYVYPRYYYHPRYPGHGDYRPPSGGGSGSGKPPWRDLNRLRQAEGQEPMRPPPRASRPSSSAPAYRPMPSAPVYRPPSGASNSEHREEARHIRAERKTESHREER